jgi:putative nucleotidyltransferase with HDIG domain
MAGKKEPAKNRSRLKPLSVILLILSAVVSLGCAATALTPKLYDLKEGSIAEETIYAPRAVTDLTTTDALKENARDSTADVYRVDEQRADSLYAEAAGFFDSVNSVRADAEKMRADAALAGTLDVPASGALTAEQWKKTVKGDVLAGFKQRTGISDDETVFSLLAADPNELLRLRELILPKLDTALHNILSEQSVASTRDVFLSELHATTLSDELKLVGETVIGNFLQATYTRDEEATDLAKDEAAGAVEPVRIERGEIIVQKGEAVSRAQLNMLLELELVREGGTDLYLYIGSSVYAALLFAAFGVYLFLFRREVFDSANSMVILTVAVIITMLLALVANKFDPKITPVLIAVIITALLVDERTALFLGAVISLLIGLMAGGKGTALLSFDSAVMMTSMLASSAAAVFALKGRQKRSAVIVAGAVGGGAAALVIAAAYIMTLKTAGQILSDAGRALGSDTVAAVLCVGTLAVWENVFDVATAARLTELSSSSHPLLRQLMAEAPGTYHHSVMVSQLAEAAAERIGANSPLAMAGALYHDVGKLKKPLYFKENQKPNENVHDIMAPEESAAAIIAHQKDGVALLHKHKLPSAVIRVAHEHHGNSLVAYFYHKACEGSEGRQVNIKAFRYQGSRPTTKESAIVMLADSCEAAVRSLGETTREAVEEMVHKVIRGKLEEGQLGNSPLTLYELDEIERSFLRTIYSLMHERIEYPEQGKAEQI